MVTRTPTAKINRPASPRAAPLAPAPVGVGVEALLELDEPDTDRGPRTPPWMVAGELLKETFAAADL